MIPPLIVSQALDLGIHILAITDHNSSSNVEAVISAAKGTELVVLPGIEIQTREDVHSLCIFEQTSQLMKFQEDVDSSLPDLINNADFFGPQFIVDSTGEFIREEKRLLLTSCSMSLEDACKKTFELGGLFIPAHVNRQANGLLVNLGFIPPELKPDALEISRHLNPEQAVKQFPDLTKYPIIQSGDVHRLSDFLAPIYFQLENASFSEIKAALCFQSGRSYKIGSG